MTSHTSVDEPRSSEPSQCWCCGRTDEPSRLVHLGNHPEVGVCTRCARFLDKQARALEDQARGGLGARVRTGLRRARQGVIRRGWHRSRVFGRVLRFLGRFTP